VIAIGTLSLRLQTIALPFTGWIMLCNMMMQTIGKSLFASILALAREGLFLLPFLFIFTPIWGLLGIQLTQPASNVISFFFSIPLTVYVLRRQLAMPDAHPHN
jgi:Na+-driven multidrug efflux pump